MPRTIRQRINFIAAANAQRAPAMKKKRHIRSESRCDFKEAPWFDTLASEPQ
jgi:hypothetical protein